MMTIKSKNRVWSYLSKALMSLAVLFFFSSCEDTEKKPVGSGSAQVYTPVFSKSCAGGSVNIKTQTLSESSTQGVTSANVDDLKAGDKVQISGTIKTSLCGMSGSASFSCNGEVRIDTNRAFVCSSGTISSGFAASSVSLPKLAPSAPASPSTSSSSTLGAPAFSTGYKMSRGEVYMYQNGTTIFTRIEVSKAPYLFHCPLSFICE